MEKQTPLDRKPSSVLNSNEIHVFFITTAQGYSYIFALGTFLKLKYPPNWLIKQKRWTIGGHFRKLIEEGFLGGNSWKSVFKEKLQLFKD